MLCSSFQDYCRVELSHTTEGPPKKKLRIDKKNTDNGQEKNIMHLNLKYLFCWSIFIFVFDNV